MTRSRPTRVGLLALTVLLPLPAFAGGVGRGPSLEMTPDLKVYTQLALDPGQPSHSGFDVSRAYLGLKAKLGDHVGGRLTLAAVEGVRSGAGHGDAAPSALDGSLVYRLKYGYLDVRLPGPAFVRMGAVQTPWIGWFEHVTETRFLGPLLLEREWHTPSSDFGLAVVGTLGDALSYHAGVYDGGGYHGLEEDDTKDLAGRLSLRPAPGVEALQCLQVSAYGRAQAPAAHAAHKHLQYGGAVTWRWVEATERDDCGVVRGERLAAWLQAVFGREGHLGADAVAHVVPALGVSLGARVELPAHLFSVLRLDRVAADVDDADSVAWRPLLSLGYRLGHHVHVAAAWQANLGPGGDDGHLVGVYTALGH